MRFLLLTLIFLSTSLVGCDKSNNNAVLLANSISQESYTVYVTPYGECYHRENCRTIKSSCKAVSKDKATSMGRRACKVCKP